MEHEEDNSAWNSKICESLVSAWWEGLLQRNRLTLKNNEAKELTPFSTLSPPIVEVIFTIAHILHQPCTVRYMTIEIFDRFVRQLFVQLQDYIKTNNSQAVSQARQWERILARTRNQTPLRIMSCMQLASKLNFSTQALSPAVIQGFLRQIKQPFSRHSIMASERRVLKTINFQFGVPACTFLQHLVGSLQELAPRSDPDRLYTTSLAVLDLAVLYYHQIVLLQHHASPLHRSVSAGVGCDYVRLSAAVVVCALTILDGYVDSVGLALHRLTDLPMRNIEQLAEIILQVACITPND